MGRENRLAEIEKMKKHFIVSGLGDVQVSGVSVAGQILFVFMMFSNAICAAGGMILLRREGGNCQ